MANSGSITAEQWKLAREKLVFYFQRRPLLASMSEDLAQHTIAKMLERGDYEFSEGDFIRVCLGFARHVAQESRRDRIRYSGGDVDPDLPALPRDFGSQKATETAILYRQVKDLAESNLSPQDRQSLLDAANAEGQAAEDRAAANRRRVRRHRAIERLRRILGLPPE